MNDRALEHKLRARSARIAVIGLGYAGLPMAVEFARAGFVTVGLDVDAAKVDAHSRRGRSPVSNVADAEIAALRGRHRLSASTDPRVLDAADVAVICVPTPLTPTRWPGPALRRNRPARRSASICMPDMLVVLQSTCGPGTTSRARTAARRRQRIARRRGLLSRLCARANRPWQHALHGQEHAQDCRRQLARIDATRLPSVRGVHRRSRAGQLARNRRTGQAGRKYVPLYQHQLHQ